MILCLHVMCPAGVDPSGSTWQPWTDQLVYAVLAGLVWGGAKLAAAEEEHARVMEAAAAYMAARPIQVSTPAVQCLHDLQLQQAAAVAVVHQTSCYSGPCNSQDLLSTMLAEAVKFFVSCRRVWSCGQCLVPLMLRMPQLPQTVEAPASWDNSGRLCRWAGLSTSSSKCLCCKL